MARRRANGEGTLTLRTDGRWQCTIMDGFQPNGKRKYTDTDDIGDGSDSQPMSESNFSSLTEEKEILINEKGEIIGEKLRERV